MKRLLRKNLFGLLALLAAGCQTEYHAYDTRVEGARDIHARNIPRIERSCSGKRTIRFAVISDTQRWYDETADAVAAINARDDIDFVINAGDITDWGLRAEFERQRDLFEQLKVPYVVLLGNHDCLVTGPLVYRKIFGEPDFAFTAGSVRFICLNTNALEFDYEGVPNFGFVEAERSAYPASCDRTIAVMHASPVSEQLNGIPAKLLHERLCSFPALQVCIHGHGHGYEVCDLFDDGILYIQNDAIEKRNYLVYTVTEKGWEHEKVDY